MRKEPVLLQDFPRAARCERIAPFYVMSLVRQAEELAAQGVDVIHLGIGEPDFPTPEAVITAGQAALAAGQTRYTSALGLPSLRQAIAQYYKTHLHVAVPWQRIVLTPGGSGALQLALAALVGPGDGVLVTDPGYPCNRHFVELVSAEPQPLLRKKDKGWAITLADVQAAWQPNTRGLVMASPDNPTGALLDPQAVAAIAQWVEAQGGFLIMDEIYQGLSVNEPWSALSAADHVIIVNSFSKYFGMTGWRLGWLVVPEVMLDDVERMAQNFFLAPPTLSQYAALAAFSEPVLKELEERRHTLLARRAYLLEAMATLGWQVTGAPEGAFYLYIDISSTTEDSFAFCEQLLQATGVALTPGVDFGAAHHPHHFIRIAYTVPQARLEEAVERIQQFLETL